MDKFEKRFSFNMHVGIWDILPEICIDFPFKTIDVGWLCFTISIYWNLEKTP